MARRSATNERYQKYTSPSGKTRKSAAQAKPKRAVGASPAPSTKSKSSSSSGKSGSATSTLSAPQSEEYRKYRRLWWILLVVALALTTASWALRQYTDLTQVSAVALGAGYASIFTALYIDWTKLRRIRQEWIKAGKPAGEFQKKTGKTSAASLKGADAATNNAADDSSSSNDESSTTS